MGWPKALRWRYSLRALFVFITLFMLWGGYHANRGWRQRAAEEILRKHGAVFGHGDCIDLRTPIPGETKLGYLRRWVGKKYEETVHSLWGDCYIKCLAVSIEDPEVIDAVEMLPQVEWLRIVPKRRSSEEQLLLNSPAGIRLCVEAPHRALARMLANKRIKSLDVVSFDLSDEDCRTIAQERSIELIGLWQCKLSGDAFARLLTRPGLRELNIRGCEIAEPALASVPASPTLEVVHCGEWSNIDLEFASYLARCPNLRTVWVWGTSDGDDFLVHLGPHSSLSELVLYGPISDQAVDSLIEMPSLQRLAVSRNALSREAKARLKNAKPELKM